MSMKLKPRLAGRALVVPGTGSPATHGTGTHGTAQGSVCGCECETMVAMAQHGTAVTAFDLA